jgi:hypothetical protein
MPSEKDIRRGEHAQALIEDEVFKEALAMTRDWAHGLFVSAKTTEELLAAKAKHEAVDYFAAVMRATMQVGKAAVEQLIRERDEMSARRRRKNAFPEYMAKATSARAEHVASKETASG